MVKVKVKAPRSAKSTSSPRFHHPFRFLLLSFLAALIGIATAVGYRFWQFEQTYQGKIYPGVLVDGVNFGGKSQHQVVEYFRIKSTPLLSRDIYLTFEDKSASLSATSLKIAYDGVFSSTQAYSIGRSGSLLTDLYHQWKALTSGVRLNSMLTFDESYIDNTLKSLSDTINIEPEDALFQFENNRVLAFKQSSSGRKLNEEKTKAAVIAFVKSTLPEMNQPIASLSAIVETLKPKIATENSNAYGIKELIGKGTSKFFHSIPGRVHNVELAASRINGHLVPPGETFSFNGVLGDISAATGYQPAYVIKEGRTVLGDGGGVCQVSTTLFRAVLNAGLPISERHAHAYRVGYYEQDSPPGIDATVYSPSYDFRFVNDTPGHILIQAAADIQNYSLEFDLYGTMDGRKADITKPVILSQVAAPADRFEDDPTSPKGIVKQVDWSAPGAKVLFNYRVERNGETIQDAKFTSVYQPWQAVFLRGTKE